MTFYGSISGQIVRLNKLKKLKLARHVTCIRGMVHTHATFYSQIWKGIWNYKDKIHLKVMWFEDVTGFF
jgi:hypothetical protein